MIAFRSTCITTAAYSQSLSKLLKILGSWMKLRMTHKIFTAMRLGRKSTVKVQKVMAMNVLVITGLSCSRPTVSRLNRKIAMA